MDLIQRILIGLDFALTSTGLMEEILIGPDSCCHRATLSLAMQAPLIATWRRLLIGPGTHILLVRSARKLCHVSPFHWARCALITGPFGLESCATWQPAIETRGDIVSVAVLV
jgi:hypothetical protein